MSFWKQRWTDYKGSWRALWAKATGFQVFMDVGLSLLLYFLIVFFAVPFALVAKGLPEILQRLGQIQSMGLSPEQNAAFVNELLPVIYPLLLRVGVLALLFVLIGTAIYALFKLMAWRRLQGRPFTWKDWFRLMLLTYGLWILFLLLLVLCSNFLPPLLAAAVLTVLLLLFVGYLPAFYAVKSWKTVFTLRFQKVYVLLLLIQFLTWDLGAILLWFSGKIGIWLNLLLLVLWLLVFMSWGRNYLALAIKSLEGKRRA